MLYRFRVQDRNLSTFNAQQKRQIKKFQGFIMQKPDSFCCVCMKVLYPEERKYRQIENVNNLSCIEWKLQPLLKPGSNDLYIVCSTHYRMEEERFPKYAYPGLYIIIIIL